MAVTANANLAIQVCWLDYDVHELEDYLACMEARLSDVCHDRTCAKMADAGAPCPGDAVINTPIGY